MRLRDRGLVEKEPYAQWLAGPLTAREITDDYELLAVLEPCGLQQTASQLPRETLMQMLEHIGDLQRKPGVATAAAVERLEQDLHVRRLAGLRNRKMAALIQLYQSPMNVSRM